MQPKSEDELHAVTVGKLEPHNRQITPADYDPLWPRLYEAQAAQIANILRERALLIEHVGSTAVPGLPAKPIIDIVLVIRDSADETAYVPYLEAGGYRLRIREPHWHEHRALKGPRTNINLHVFSSGCPVIARMLGFRDHLRTNALSRERYASAKRELARQTWKYVQHYADAKTAVIHEILGDAGFGDAGSLKGM